MKSLLIVVSTFLVVFSSMCVQWCEGRRPPVANNIHQSPCPYERLDTCPLRCRYLNPERQLILPRPNCTNVKSCVYRLPDGRSIMGYICTRASYCDNCPKKPCETEAICIHGKENYRGEVYRIRNCRCPWRYVYVPVRKAYESAGKKCMEPKPSSPKYPTIGYRPN